MAKKNKAKEPVKPAAIPVPVAKQSASFTLNSNSFFPLLGCFLYFVVHFIPDFGGYDAMGSQWMYLVTLDLLIIVYIVARKNDYQLNAAKVFNNLFSKLYLAFFVLAGISVFVAINPTEGWVCYVRMIATVIAYFNMAILLKGRVDLFKILAQVLALILFVEAFQTISKFANGLPEATTDEAFTLLIMSLKGEAGNKNIFAAGLVVKVPFVIYGIHRFKLMGKVVNMVILILASLAIFLVNARATFLSLILVFVLYITFCIIDHFKEKKTERTLYRIGFVVIAFVIAFFIDQVAFTRTAAVEAGATNFGSVTERLASVAQTSDESNQVRFRLWAHAIDYTKQHPFMGCGLGNWKIASIPYQRTITNDLYVPIHAHNDFLEVFAELGIPGGLLYLSLFICLIVLTIKTFYSSADEETKLMAVFSLIAFTTYMIDALFNFPLERPISQVFFAFLTAVNVGAFIKGREEQRDEKILSQKAGFFTPVYALISILLLIPSFYVTYLTYQSLILQKSVLGDLNNEPLKMDWKMVTTSFPSIPNLSATAQPIDAIKGRYLYEAGKFDEALVLLNKGSKANPVIGYSEFLKAGLYYKQDKLDSAFRNGMAAFYTRPKAKTYYQTLIAVLARMKDTANIKKAFREYDRYRHHAYGWDLFLRGMINAESTMGKLMPNLLTFADSALILFPDDPELLQRISEIQRGLAFSNTKTNTADMAAAVKYYASGVAAFGTGVPGKDDLEKAAGYFLKSAALNPTDYTAIENAAICYFNMKQWQRAITYFDKELATKMSTNGKPEYFKGVALINLGKKEEGCNYMQTANNKGWAGAAAILKSNCGK
jgi:O-antigen ligase/tetratricopeptide (TPR) repeat protein